MQLANLSNPKENKMKSKTDSWKLNFFKKKMWKTKMSCQAFLWIFKLYLSSDERGKHAKISKMALAARCASIKSWNATRKLIKSRRKQNEIQNSFMKIELFLKKKVKNENQLCNMLAFLSNLNVYFEQLQAKETSSNSKNGVSGKVRTPKIFKCNSQTYQIQKKTKWNPKQIHENWTFLKKKVKNENLLSSVFMQFEAISWALTSQRNKVGFQKWR